MCASKWPWNGPDETFLWGAAFPQAGESTYLWEVGCSPDVCWAGNVLSERLAANPAKSGFAGMTGGFRKCRRMAGGRRSMYGGATVLAKMTGGSLRRFCLTGTMPYGISKRRSANGFARTDVGVWRSECPCTDGRLGFYRCGSNAKGLRPWG